MAKTSYLPLDIVETILSKLSVKPLLRFKTVSKLWNTMISDPVFVQNHHHKSKSSNSHNLFLCELSSSFSDGFSLVKLEDRKLQTVKVLDGPYGGLKVLCFCEGVLLLADHSYKRQVLWNPSTRMETELWAPHNCYGSSFGLCHDPITDDFKVVIMSWKRYSVYSCKNKSWMKRKEFTDGYNGYGLIDSESGLSVDGAIYWVWRRKNVTEIMYYDPRDDKFKILQKPKNVKDSKLIYLFDLRGCLCLYCNGRDEDTVQIWIKEKGLDKNSWKELITIENVQSWSMEPQCFVGNKIVIRKKDDYKLVVYSLSEKRFERFEGTKVNGLGLIP